MALKILLVQDYVGPDGGAEILLLRIAKELRIRGHETRVLAGIQPGVSGIDYPVKITSGNLNRALSLYNPWSVRQMSRALADFRPDVVHLRMFLGHISPSILPLLADVPTIYHGVLYEAVCPEGTKLLKDGSACAEQAGTACLQCLRPQGWVPAMLKRQLLKRWSKSIDVTLANSTHMGKVLMDDFFQDVKVVPNGVPILPPRPPLGNVPTIGYAGRLEVPKGIHVLMEAFRKLRQTAPETRLLVAGRGSQESLVRNQENVEYLGWVPAENISEALSSCWVQVVPSVWNEPFGLVAAEALMRGTAVVASRGGGLSDIVRSGETGVLVTPGDVGELTSALQWILDRERAERCGKLGREDAIRRFSLDTMVDRLVEIYMGMVKQN